MNMQNLDILLSIHENGYTNQRILAEQSGYSLGTVNKAIRNLIETGMLNEDFELTASTINVLKAKKPRNAIILAAGAGMRMIPINFEVSKAMLEVHGERLIERQIRQLNEKGIYDITIVVGFMKEQFEYLVDKYGVKLVVNSEYSSKNNLYSIRKVIDQISNTYILPCDVWLKNNPFNEYELYPWYMVTDAEDEYSDFRVNRKQQLVSTEGCVCGNKMIGIAYLPEGEQLTYIKNKIKKLTAENRSRNLFWEDALVDKSRFIINARVIQNDDAIEINTYEQLREVDSDSNQLKSDVLQLIADVLDCSISEIVNIMLLKKGMTNRSFLFEIKNGKNSGKYIMRIPGEGTEQLIDRNAEFNAYEAIKGKGFCDQPVYINPINGYKITRYIEGVRCCDPYNEHDLKKCMNKLREFHNYRINGTALAVPNTFDLVERLDFYESLWEGNSSAYSDYEVTKENCKKLLPFIEKQRGELQLTHIDAVPDNFLFDQHGNIQLTDWEYAGMQDKHVDIAMFCIYSMYDKKHIDKLIDIYFEEEGGCNLLTRAKIYAYISICGLIWSNWCEYKRNLGVEFGEYSLYQYRYGKEYYRHTVELLNKAGEVLS